MADPEKQHQDNGTSLSLSEKEEQSKPSPTSPSLSPDSKSPSSRSSTCTEIISPPPQSPPRTSQQLDHDTAPPPSPPPFTIHSPRTKTLLILFASLSALFSPLTAQIYLPALPPLSESFSVSPSQINLTITTYMIFQGITPPILGSFADALGRRPTYIICFTIFIAANIGLALCQNYTSLLVIRCIQSAGSSTTVALCQAVVADIITSAERGGYIGITAIPTVLAPSLGPVLGGVLSQYLGWRWIFWVLAIAGGVNLVGILVFYPETCREIVGDGSQRTHWVYKTFWRLGREALTRRNKRKEKEQRHVEQGLRRRESTATGISRRSGTGSVKTKFRFKSPNFIASLVLLFENELGVLLLYSGVVFAGFYATATAMPSQFTELYGLTDLQIGLMYLPMAGGSIIAAFVVGPLMNKNYARHAVKLGMPVDKTREMDLSKFPIERARLELGIPLLVLTTLVTISWGWAIEYRAHLAIPCVLLFLQGLGLVGFINTVNALIVDIHPSKAGSAVAANNLTRCILGAASSAAIVPMINAWGAGGAFTFFGGLFVVFAPAIWLVMHFGIRWRGDYHDKEARKEERRREKEASSK
ncbi:Major facilitator superfamily domain containing protein [Naviculisporaceae sp. PSN 640]